MEITETENEIIISREEYERFNWLKKYRRNIIEQFDMIRALVFRLNVFINLLIEDNDDYDKIILNIQIAIEELSDNCNAYENLIDS